MKARLKISRIRGAEPLSLQARRRPSFPKPGLARPFVHSRQIQLVPELKRRREGELLMTCNSACRKQNDAFRYFNNFMMALQW